MVRGGSRQGRGRSRILLSLAAAPLAAWLLAGALSTRAVAPPAPAVAATCEGSAPPDAPALDAPRRADLLARMGVPGWHAGGWRGQGVRVAVLDSGFRGYRDHLGKALPSTVTTRSFRLDGDLEARPSQHGILCAEVIHALAPQAELLFANWEPERPDQFLAAVRWARRLGARVLSCSIIMPTWSDGEGHGHTHAELARLLSSGGPAGDALFFASAGNTAQRHWSGAFDDDGTGCHLWDRRGGAAQTANALRPWGSGPVSVELCCSGEASYEVIVERAGGGGVVGRSRSEEYGGAGTAVVAFSPEAGHEYGVRVRRLGGRPGRFHLVVLGGGLACSSRQGSIPFPGDGAETLAVGAVDTAGRRLRYSSCGPKDGPTKPDFVACVPFPSGWRAKPFAGTSAAAPQAAALAALVWSRHADWSAGQVRAGLREAATARTQGAAWEIGRGVVRLPDDKGPERGTARGPSRGLERQGGRVGPAFNR